MFVPEYTITNNTLKNVAGAEYAKAIIESTTLTPKWVKNLEKEAKTRTVYYSLLREGLNVDFDTVKRFISGLPTTAPPEIRYYVKSMDLIDRMVRKIDLDVEDIKEIYQAFNNKTYYRRTKIDNRLPSEEILAEINALVDWYNSLDAKDTHPLVVTAIVKARIEYIAPFETGNNLLGDWLGRLCLYKANYSVKSFYAPEEYYIQSLRAYNDAFYDAVQEDDLTRWIEYWIEGFNRELSNIAENVKILARDTKIARAVGDHMRLSDRQEKVVEYLQDFGLLQNSDFPKLFPRISEDTVLRELKDLIDKGILVKKGKTKSSRYELV